MGRLDSHSALCAGLPSLLPARSPTRATASVALRGPFRLKAHVLVPPNTAHPTSARLRHIRPSWPDRILFDVAQHGEQMVILFDGKGPETAMPHMREHRLFTKQTKMWVYFAHPLSPWERGTNENTNGLLRQFFPKDTRFQQRSRTEIKRVQTMLNDRPRKILTGIGPRMPFTTCCTRRLNVP